MEGAGRSFLGAGDDPAPLTGSGCVRRRPRWLRLLLAGLTVPVLVMIPFYYAVSAIGLLDDSHDAAWYLGHVDGMREAVERAAIEGRRDVSLPGGETIALTIDPALQREVTQTLSDQKPDVGAFMAVEPATGRVLAISGYREGVGGILDPALNSDYPAASLVKLVTASAAIEALDFSPQTKICYRTGVLSLTAKDIEAPETDRYPSMTLSDAMAKSANSIFGKLAASYVGQETLKRYLDGFCFDRPIPFDLGEMVSVTEIPTDGLQLAMAGAGFGHVMLSPVHAAALGASLANGGVMMRPYLIDTIRDAAGDVLYEAKGQSIATPVTRETAADIVTMMKETPVSGTLRKTFPGGKWADFARKHEIAGKTGTLSWGTPRLYYRWILGIAPAEKPTICIAALTGSQEPRLAKSSYLAREALAEYFDFEEGLVSAPKAPAKKAPQKAAKRRRSHS